MAKIIRIGDIEIEKQKFHQHEELISLKKLYINTITVSSKVVFGNKGLNISLATRMLEKLDLNVYFCQK